MAYTSMEQWILMYSLYLRPAYRPWYLRDASANQGSRDCLVALLFVWLSQSYQWLSSWDPNLYRNPASAGVGDQCIHGL